MQILIKICCLKIHHKQSIIAVNNFSHFRDRNTSKNVCVCAFSLLIYKTVQYSKVEINPNSKTTNPKQNIGNEFV